MQESSKLASSVAIIGYGYVGKAIEAFFKDHFEVLIYDPAYPQYASSEAKEKINREAGLAVICVPTPMKDDRSVDTSYVEDALSWLTTPLILMKSTVPPGTTDALRAKTGKALAFSPEYIGEGKYEVPYWKDHPHPTDMKKHSFVTIGGPKEVTRALVPYFQRIMGAEPRIFQTDSTTAELAKYMENAYLATKVTFCNEFYDIANAFGVDYHELRELWLADGRIGRSHTAVFPFSRGFGGKCLPKDTNGIIERAKEKGYVPHLLSAVVDANARIRGESGTTQPLRK